MDSHFSDCRLDSESNRRNGKMSKLMKTATGSFEPEIVKKRQTVLNESLDNKVLELYALVPYQH